MKKQLPGVTLYPAGSKPPDGCVASCTAMRFTLAVLSGTGTSVSCQCGELNPGQQLRLSGSAVPTTAGYNTVVVLAKMPPPATGGEYGYPLHRCVRLEL